MLKPIGHKTLPRPEDVVLPEGTPQDEVDKYVAVGKTVWIRTQEGFLKVGEPHGS